MLLLEVSKELLNSSPAFSWRFFTREVLSDMKSWTFTLFLDSAGVWPKHPAPQRFPKLCKALFLTWSGAQNMVDACCSLCRSLPARLFKASCSSQDADLRQQRPGVPGCSGNLAACAVHITRASVAARQRQRFGTVLPWPRCHCAFCVRPSCSFRACRVLTGFEGENRSFS